MNHPPAAQPSAPRFDGASVDLSTELAGLSLPRPVLLASGTAMYGKEISAFLDLSQIGAVITKSVLSRPWNGMPPVRGATTPSGMLNCIGLQGEGIDALLNEHLPWLHEHGARTVVSIAGHSIDEYAEVATRIAKHPSVLEAVEINISCPNVEDRNKVFSRSAQTAAQVIAGVRASLPHVTLLAKLSPDVTDIVEIAHACVEAGASGLSLINTLMGAAINLRTLRPTLSGTFGGLSGPAIKPIAVRCIYQVHQAMPQVPILGGGGVRSGRDALELTLAGASALTVGTVNFEEPGAAARISAELGDLLAEHGISAYRDAVGLAHRAEWPTARTKETL